MSEAAAAKPKKKSAPKKPAEHPKFEEMIKTAITTLKERNGSSRQAIVKYIRANYKVGDNVEVHIKLSLKRLVAAGKLNQTKGTGASGSFKVVKVVVEKKPKKKPAVKKTAAKKKKPAAKKPAAKKAAAKKKASKPAAKKTSKKAKTTPKKKPAPKKPASKKPAAKKPAAKKPAAKKGAKKTKKAASKKSKK